MDVSRATGLKQAGKLPERTAGLGRRPPCDTAVTGAESRGEGMPRTLGRSSRCGALLARRGPAKAGRSARPGAPRELAAGGGRRRRSALSPPGRVAQVAEITALPRRHAGCAAARGVRRTGRDREAQVRAPPPRGGRALPRGAGQSADALRRYRAGLRTPTARLRAERARALRRLRRARARLRRAGVPRLRRATCRRFQLQRPGLLPVVSRPAHGLDRRRSLSSTSSRPPRRCASGC